jgi:AcrR family transcriptional regulator
LPRQPDPDLEQRILDAASRLWARGGEKALTMRAVAKAAGTTTPTVYERYRDREDLLRALRLKTRTELFAALSRTHTLHDSVQRHLLFALEHSHAYEVLFDGVGQPPSLHEAWPTFNLIRERVTQLIGGTPKQHNRLMLILWSLLHGAAMLIIRGRFEGALRVQTVHSCIDACDAVVAAARSRRFRNSGPKWPANLVLGEGKKSRVGNGNGKRDSKSLRNRKRV